MGGFNSTVADWIFNNPAIEEGDGEEVDDEVSILELNFLGGFAVIRLGVFFLTS